MKWPSKPRIGLDIGNRTLKALKLKKSGDKIYLERYFFYDLAEGNAKFPQVAAIEETLKALVDVAGFKKHLVSGSIDDADVSTFDLQLPKMPDSDLNEAVANEIESRINYPIEEASVDHIVLKETERDGEITLDLRAYCARMSDIKAILGVLDDASLSLDTLDVTMLANIGMLNFNGYLTDDVFNVVLDIGETKISAALVHGKKPVTTNVVPISLGAINRALQDQLKMSYLDAEKLKNSTAQKQEGAAAEASAMALNVVDGVYLEIFQQLQRSMDFFRSMAKGQPIDKILAIGGGAQYGSVLSTIEATCGAPTIAANPFRNIEIFDKKGKSNNEKIGTLAPHMATAVGLALRGLNVA